MNTDIDPFWDDLGIAWRAIDLVPESLTPRLRKQLKRETWRKRLSAAFGTLGLAVGVAFVAWAFKSKGAWNKFYGALLFTWITLGAGLSVWGLRHRREGDMKSLSGMLELSIARAKRTQREARVWPIAVLFLLPVAGLVVFGPASGARKIGLLIFLAVCAIGFIAWGRWSQRQGRERQARFEYLKRELAGHDRPD
jgi:hypothetical protein